MPTPTLHSLTRSLWHRELSLRQQFDRLAATHRTDVLVVGAGITGLTTASTGHLDAHPEMGPAALMDQLGLSEAVTYTRLRSEAIAAFGYLRLFQAINFAVILATCEPWNRAMA